MKTCPSCKEVYEDEKKFCRKCGTALSAEKVVAPESLPKDYEHSSVGLQAGKSGAPGNQDLREHNSKTKVLPGLATKRTRVSIQVAAVSAFVVILVAVFLILHWHFNGGILTTKKPAAAPTVPKSSSEPIEKQTKRPVGPAQPPNVEQSMEGVANGPPGSSQKLSNATQVAPAFRPPEKINIVAGSTGMCGSHQGSFEATYQGKKIEIDFSYNPTPTNPVVHPVKVFRGTEEVKDWDSYICMFPGPTALAGKTATVEGRWSDTNTFEAYKVSLDPTVSHTQTAPVQSSPTYTPAPGSNDRKQLMNALRNKYRPNVVFVIKHLKVSGDWAWATVTPQSSDGKEYYEDQSALFRREGTQWVLKGTVGRAGEDARVQFRHLLAKYPNIPDSVFDMKQ